MAQLEPRAKSLVHHHPQHPLGWMLLAAIFKGRKEFADALAAQQQAIALLPDKAELHSNLGSIELKLGMVGAAEISFRKAIEIDPSFFDGQFNLGLLLKGAKRLDEARITLRRALDLDPSSANCWYQAGLVLQEQKNLPHAALFFEKALSLQPNHADALDALSYIHLRLGDIVRARELGIKSVSAAPDRLDILSNLIFMESYFVDSAATSFAKIYGQRVGAAVAADDRAAAALSAGQVHDVRRKIRVGFVSGDFKDHPVAYFLAAVIERGDNRTCEYIAYATVEFEDATTQRLKTCFDAWHCIANLDDHDGVDLIRRHQVDILIDLAGHTAHNRLGLFARRAAALQVSWLGYFATTGIAEMDFVLSDSTSLPPQSEADFTEEIWPLPTRLCYTMPEAAPPVSELPALERGHLTIGCFQNLGKVNDDVMKTWSDVFARLPSARLRWQASEFAEPEAIRRTAARMERAGLHAGRVDLLAGQPRCAYLKAHAEVDIVLDTFPYPGGTTTCDALWMGVPTLTLTGRGMLARQGAALLAAAGLPDWITHSTEQYAETVVRLGHELQGLSVLRRSLRARLAGSLLFDAARFARDFEAAMHGIWQRKKST